MIQIMKLAESTHEKTFVRHNITGYPYYLLLLVKTPAHFFYDNQFNDTSSDVAFVFPPHQPYLYRADSSQECYTDCWLHFQLDKPLFPEHFPFGRPIVLHSPEEFYNLFHMINVEFYGTTPNKNRIVDNLTKALLHKILDASNTKEYSPLYYKLLALREQIYTNPEADWNIDDIARTLSVSTGYFHTTYKHFFNTTCIADVIQSRIQKASDLLLCTNSSIEEISELCGYHNVEHFIRQFKKETNVTPLKYKTMNHSNISSANQE